VTGPDPDREFPRIRESVYLNHAASSPLPRRSADALRAYLDDRERVAHLYQAGRQDYDTTALKAKLARLVNAVPEAVGFVPTTIDGVSGALNGIRWRPGDNVVLAADEFPGVLYAALNLAGRGIEVRQVPVREHAEVGALLDRIDRRTRAVVASHVHWQSGHRLDLEQLGHGCRAAGTLSIVDAIQSLGAWPIDFTASGVDVLVAGSYKWLMAVPGVAVLYGSARAIDAIAPDRAGWTGMATSVHAKPDLDWAPGARRYQVGGQPDPALIALERSVDLVLELEPARIASHVLQLHDRLVAGAAAVGVKIGSSLAPADRSGILQLTTGTGERDDRLVTSLLARGIIVARRGGGIRVSPHWHNPIEDIDRLVEAISRFD
jgi:selenocysteine lyase/cysteine desulfurase